MPRVYRTPVNRGAADGLLPGFGVSLAGAFFAGDPERPKPRTIFAVGDEKQSIFSFQGADPRAMEDARRHFQDKAADAEQSFHATPLQLSFRSAPEILAAVDQVFDRADLRASIAIDPDEPVVHEAWKSHLAGRVEIWPRTQDSQSDVPEAWETPQDAPGSGTLALAGQIAEEIERYRSGDLRLAGGKASMGGIIVLVRKRGTFAAAMNAELKRRGLPVAGADRIALGSHIAVLDCLALGDVVLLPQNDLALAALLKSPLVGLDEDHHLFPSRALKGLRRGVVLVVANDFEGLSLAVLSQARFLIP